MWQLQFKRKLREQIADYVQYAERYQERRSELAHEVRGIEQVQYLQNTKTYQQIRSEDAQNVHPAYPQYPPSGHLHAEQKGDGQQ